ncbi:MULTISPECIES: CD3324 family protein [Clostridia]|uniref:CD3324 family protein n=1 Tax=Clostridia TaxID=186801 RepID=UPI00051BB622|nr:MULTISPECIES: CD3324 family protein [Clostridia]WOO35391.1 CD3324 family protein [Anaerocolumna sp. AGMB13020]
MNYKKGADVLPDQLLKEVQQYAEGCLVYIPKRSSKAQWGCISGTREWIDKRNEEITCLFRQGEPVKNLSEEYHLSEDTIRKIIYKRNQI